MFQTYPKHALPEITKKKVTTHQEDLIVPILDLEKTNKENATGKKRERKRERVRGREGARKEGRLGSIKQGLHYR